MKYLLPAFAAAFFLLWGCGSNPADDQGFNQPYDSSKPGGYVYDDCGDSVAVNYHFDLNNPGEVVVDSLTVNGVKIVYGSNSIDTVRTKVKVGVSVKAGGGTYRFEMDPRDDGEFIADCFTWIAPKITEQPVDDSVGDGDDADFSITATDGDATGSESGDKNSYAWYKNGVLIADTNVFDYFDYSDTTITPKGGAEINFTAAYADNNAKIKCVVSNAHGSVTSKEVKLKVSPVAPSISLFEIDQPYNNGHITASVLFEGNDYFAQVSAHGSALTYKWTLGGVTQSSTTNKLDPLVVAKSDSGKVLKCVISNAFGSDSASSTLQVMYPSWSLQTIDIQIPGGSYGGSLLDFDTSGYVDNFPGSDINAIQERLDLVLGPVGGKNKLLSPKLAKKLAISSTSALDSTRLTATKMVITSASIGYQENAKALYEQGVKVDSVTIDNSGYIGGNSANQIILKTGAGRFIVIPKATTVYSGGEYYFYQSVMKGTVLP